jgi:hypothetical protein
MLAQAAAVAQQLPLVPAQVERCHRHCYRSAEAVQPEAPLMAAAWLLRLSPAAA